MQRSHKTWMQKKLSSSFLGEPCGQDGNPDLVDAFGSSFRTNPETFNQINYLTDELEVA